jgi:predicted DCC family thiol-disulfide oxidoreductase YuxK
MSELQVFYDGACPLCSKEIEHYRKLDTSTKVDFIDIASSGFDESLFGLEGRDFHRKFHVKKANGEFLEGLEAFQEIWTCLDCFTALNKLTRMPVIEPLAKASYTLFSVIRPYLPKKECGTDQCYKV